MRDLPRQRSLHEGEPADDDRLGEERTKRPPKLKRSRGRARRKGNKHKVEGMHRRRNRNG